MDMREKIACAVAEKLIELDGLTMDDAMTLQWQGNPPEPYGDAWNADYLPKGGVIADAIIAALREQEPVGEVTTALDYPDKHGTYASCISSSKPLQEGATLYALPIPPVEQADSTVDRKLANFARNFVSSQVQIEPELQRIINENMSAMLSDDAALFEQQPGEKP